MSLRERIEGIFKKSPSAQEQQAKEMVRIFAKEKCEGLLQIPDNEFKTKHFIEFINNFMVLTGSRKEGNKTTSNPLIDEHVSRSITLFTETTEEGTSAGIFLDFSFPQKDLPSIFASATMPLVQEKLTCIKNNQTVVEFEIWPKKVIRKEVHEYLFYSFLADKNMTDDIKESQIDNKGLAKYPTVQIPPKRLKELGSILLNNQTVYQRSKNSFPKNPETS